MVKQKKSAHRGVKIVKLRDGRHVARWLDPVERRKERQQSLDALGLSNATQRKAWCIDKLESIKAVRKVVASGSGVVTDLPLKDAAERYVASKERAASTVAGLRPILASWVDWMYARRADTTTKLTEDLLQIYRNHIMATTDRRKVTTKRRMLGQVKSFVMWMVKQKMSPLLTRADLDVITDDIKTPAPTIEVLKPRQLRAVLVACFESDPEFAPFVMALALSGCRFGEMQGLTWPEVDFDEHEIDLPAHRVKTNKARSVTMRESPTLAALLRALHAQGRERPFWSNGASRDAASQQFYLLRDRMVKNHGVRRVKPKTFRSTCASILANAPSIYKASAPLRSAFRCGHDLATASQHYLGLLQNLPEDAKTIEDAAGIRDICNEIVAYIEGGGACR
ncbi:MAG: integrase [Planctomycetota bacterium]|jgi:integrase